MINIDIKNNKKSLVFAIITVLIIIVAVFFFIKAQKNDVIEVETVDSNSLNTDSVDPNVVNTINTPTVKPKISEADEARFNTLMSDGAKAFNTKDYNKAIDLYNKALSIQISDFVYIRLFDIYNVQGNISKAEEMINLAIKKDPSYTDYWNTKLVFLDERTNTSYQNLKKIYEEALLKINQKTAINLVTTFARIAENNKEKSEAIKLWQKAIELNPTMKAAYQAEIDALNK